MTTLATMPAPLTIGGPFRNRPTASPASVRNARPTFLCAALPGCEIRLHSTCERYESHVEKHLATDEALRALAFAHPDLAAREAMASPRDIVRALRRGVSHEAGRELREAYLALAARTLDEALAVDWIVQPNQAVTVALSPTGFLAVVDRGTLVTIMVPGLVADDIRLERVGYGRVEARAQRRRERDWDPATRHFHTVFRRAIHVVRSLPTDARGGEHSQYGALKRVLPGASKLRFEGWLLHMRAARAAHDQRHG